MTISTGDLLKGLFSAAEAVGQKAVSSDAYLEIDGSEGIGLLTKQFVWPVLSSAGEIESSGPLGSASWQAQQIKTNQQGSVSFYETVTGQIDAFLKAVIAKGGYVDATAYEGTPDFFTRKARLRKCFFVMDPVEQDFENRGQLKMITGTMFYHYFGE